MESPDENSSTSTSSSSVTMQKPILLRASMLRPSAFSASSFASLKTTTDQIANPDKDTETTTTTSTATATDEKPIDAAATTTTTTSEASTDLPQNTTTKPEDPLAQVTKSNGLARSNPFTAVQVTPLATTSSFVFGQNTRDRVTGNNNNGDDEDGAESNGDLSFSAAVSSTQKSTGSEEGAASSENGTGPDNDKGEAAAAAGKSLSEVAREYEENKNARKRKFEEVETFTGEEDEINVLDVTCKLYTFAQVYEERGRGSLRLNDPKRGEDTASRLVFRTSGSLRVLLNTKIWAEMIAEQASAKSLRITAIDATGQVKVYLVMARPSDIQMLVTALNLRIAAEKAKETNVEGEEKKKDTKTTNSNGNWDEEEQATVTPDVIADVPTAKRAEEVKDGDGGESDDLEHVTVQVPVLKKRRSLEPVEDGVDGTKEEEMEVKETSTTLEPEQISE